MCFLTYLLDYLVFFSWYLVLGPNISLLLLGHIYCIVPLCCGRWSSTLLSCPTFLVSIIAIPYHLTGLQVIIWEAKDTLSLWQNWDNAFLPIIAAQFPTLPLPSQSSPRTYRADLRTNQFVDTVLCPDCSASQDKNNLLQKINVLTSSHRMYSMVHSLICH